MDGKLIKARLALLGKTQKELLHELNRRGYKIKNVNELYGYTNERNIESPKSKVILTGCCKILDEWEKINENKEAVT